MLTRDTRSQGRDSFQSSLSQSSQNFLPKQRKAHSLGRQKRKQELPDPRQKDKKHSARQWSGKTKHVLGRQLCLRDLAAPPDQAPEHCRGRGQGDPVLQKSSQRLFLGIAGQGQNASQNVRTRPLQAELSLVSAFG